MTTPPAPGPGMDEANRLVAEDSEKVSGLVVGANLAVMGINWAVMIGKDSARIHLTLPIKGQVLGIYFLTLISLALHGAQYLSRYALDRRVQVDISKGILDRPRYAIRDPLYRFAFRAFKAKIVITMATLIWFAGVYAFLLIAPENLMAQSINGVWVGSINDGDTHYLTVQDNKQCLLDQVPQCLRQEYADQPSCSYSTDDGKTYTVNLCKQDGKFVLQVQLVQECCSLDGTWSSEKLSESGKVSLAKTTPCVAPQ